MSYQVLIEPLGETIDVKEGQDAALRAGVYMPYSCGHGLYSTCKIDVLEAKVDLGDAQRMLVYEIREGLLMGVGGETMGKLGR